MSADFAMLTFQSASIFPRFVLRSSLISINMLSLSMVIFATLVPSSSLPNLNRFGLNHQILVHCLNISAVNQGLLVHIVYLMTVLIFD